MGSIGRMIGSCSVLGHSNIAIRQQPNVIHHFSRTVHRIDRSKVPTLDENDLEEKFISGGGPGGQKVNKAVNCCQLRHKPTNIIVKVHQSRSLQQNRQLARELLINRLDNLYNGEDSVENQKKRIEMYHQSVRRSQAEIRRAMKAEFKKQQLQEQKEDL